MTLTRISMLLCVLAALAVAACPSPPPRSTPPTEPTPVEPEPDAGSGGGKGGTTAKADGEACAAAADCLSGICEGQGCGATSGACMSRDRMCTMDAVEYCGCDDTTFTSSGGCPGRLFKHRGPCTP